MIVARLDGHLLALLVVTVAVALLLVVGLALRLVLGLVHSLVVLLALWVYKYTSYLCILCENTHSLKKPDFLHISEKSELGSNELTSSL